jgi:micrococcal nuclease
MKFFTAGLTTGIVLCFSAVAYIEHAHQSTGGISSYTLPLITKLESSIPIQLSNTAPVSPKPSTNAVTAKVLRVIDGDTIDVELNEERQRVRYIGMNTPERDEPCFNEATQANVDLVAGKEVRLERDVSDTDRYGRLLRYVFVNNTFVNEALVAGGYAEAVLYRPDGKHYELFSQLEVEAAQTRLGCHGSGVFNDGDARK